MERRLTRIDPALPVDSMKTYAIDAPISTHFRPATCKEVDCPNYLKGWTTSIDSSTELGKRQLAYIRLKSGRAYQDASTPGGTVVTLRFPPGQECFTKHQVPLERNPIFMTRDGDWRGSRGAPSIFHKPDDWVEDFAEHQDKLANEIKRG